MWGTWLADVQLSLPFRYGYSGFFKDQPRPLFHHFLSLWNKGAVLTELHALQEESPLHPGRAVPVIQFKEAALPPLRDEMQGRSQDRKRVGKWAPYCHFNHVCHGDHKRLACRSHQGERDPKGQRENDPKGQRERVIPRDKK